MDSCAFLMQEFLRNNTTHSESSGELKTKSQRPRNRCKASRTRSPRKSQASVKAKQRSTSVAQEPQSVPVTVSFGKFSSESQQNLHTRQMARRSMLCTSTRDTRTLTYAERMKDYIAQSLIEDNENDLSQSPPTLTHVYSDLPATASSESRHLSTRSTRSENISTLHLDSVPSVRHAVPCMDAFTPCKSETEISDSSPMAKRRLFVDASEAGSKRNLSGRINAETIAGQRHYQNGYHTLQKFFTSSLNGKSLGPVDHYEDGLLAIANAACLMSTGVSDGCRDQTTVSKDEGWC